MQQYLVSNSGFKGIWQEPPAELQQRLGGNSGSVTYVKVMKGNFAGLEAVAVGGNSMKRDRTACYTLVLAALATANQPDLLRKLREWYGNLQHHMSTLSVKIGPPPTAMGSQHRPHRPQLREESPKQPTHTGALAVPEARPLPKVVASLQQESQSMQQLESRLHAVELEKQQQHQELTTEIAAYRRLQGHLQVAELAEQRQAAEILQQQQLDAEASAREQEHAAVKAKYQAGQRVFETDLEATKMHLRGAEVREEQKHEQLAAEVEAHEHLQARLQDLHLEEQRCQQHLASETSVHEQLKGRLEFHEDAERHQREARLKQQLASRQQAAELENQQGLLQNRAETSEQQHQERFALEAVQARQLLGRLEALELAQSEENLCHSLALARTSSEKEAMEQTISESAACAENLSSRLAQIQALVQSQAELNQQGAASTNEQAESQALKEHISISFAEDVTCESLESRFEDMEECVSQSQLEIHRLSTSVAEKQSENEFWQQRSTDAPTLRNTIYFFGPYFPVK